jgi:hypothetical protein
VEKPQFVAPTVDSLYTAHQGYSTPARATPTACGLNVNPSASIATRAVGRGKARPDLSCRIEHLSLRAPPASGALTAHITRRTSKWISAWINILARADIPLRVA